MDLIKRCLMGMTVAVILPLICVVLVHAESDCSDQWEFQLAPYAWLAGQKGEVATLPGFPPTDIDIDFYDDIFGNINGAIFLVGEARKDRYGMLMDIAYTDIEFEDTTPGPFFSSVKSRTKSWMVTAAGLYRLIQEPGVFLDLIAGARYWSVDSTLSLGAGILDPQKVSNREGWVDPVIGLKGLSPIGESKFFVSGSLVLGGFGVGSDFMWDAIANLGYQWTEGFSTTLGYRYLDVDYEDNDFLYDVAQSGLVFGLSWRF
ncbi:MAG: hypothetical protein HF978_17630 [Desulfobacteraceae bacterium]|nr:hypothetical protein [Desulfobacteraceae bacterium]MBC2757368.1 hypothetical protein [Desulfobacteraceae bacterium]